MKSSGALFALALVVAGMGTWSFERRAHAARLSACSTAEIPHVELDTVLSTDKASVEVRYSEPGTGEQMELVLPYEPDIDFAGCSLSALRVLMSVRDADPAWQVPPHVADSRMQY